MDKKSKKSILIGITSLFVIALLLIGLTYAYYRTRIIENPNDTSISVTSKDLEITYHDGNNFIEANDMVPSKSIKKTFSVENTGDAKVENYVVYLEEVVNTLVRYEDYQYVLTCSSTLDNTCNGNSGYYPNKNDVLVYNSLEFGETHEYELVITYVEAGVDQSVDMGNKIEGKIQIYDSYSAGSLNVSDQELLAKKLYGVDIKYGDTINVSAGVARETINWNFLGIEDGHILLLADTNVTDLTISGREGYLNALASLQAAVEPYGTGEHIYKVRSVTAEDVNKVTGYNPEKELTGRPYEYGNQTEYGRTGTWTIAPTEDGVGKIVFTNDANPPITGEDLDPKFLLPNGVQLGEGEVHTETNNYYWYQATATGTSHRDTASNTDILTISQNKLDLFKVKTENLNPAGTLGTVERANRYWLANDCILGKVGNLSRGIMHLGSTETTIRVYRERIVNSYAQEASYTYGVRPVIYLEKGITLTYDDANSVWNIG